MQNARRTPRVPFAAQAVLRAGPTERQSKLVNFSERGCFLETSASLPVASHVQLSFRIADLVLGCQAVVRHENLTGIGLEFIQLDRATLAAFRALVNLIKR